MRQFQIIAHAHQLAERDDVNIEGARTPVFVAFAAVRVLDFVRGTQQFAGRERRENAHDAVVEIGLFGAYGRGAGRESGRAHVGTPVTWPARMPSSAWKTKRHTRNSR